MELKGHGPANNKADSEKRQIVKCVAFKKSRGQNKLKSAETGA